MECFLPFLVLVSRLIFNNCFSRGCFSHSEQPTGSAVRGQNLWFHPDTRMWRFCKASTAAGDMTPGFRKVLSGFPGGAVVENLPANAGDTGSSPGLGRSHMPWSN